jgi:hypothetical protein
MLLAGQAIDAQGSLWTQSYSGEVRPEGPDYLIKIDRSILEAKADDKGVIDSGVPTTFVQLPTNMSVLQRVTLGPDNESMWFTELFADREGVVTWSQEADETGGHQLQVGHSI